MTTAFDAAMLVLRVWAGIVFLAHGVKHAMGREKTTAWFAGMGWRRPEFQWFASTATELGVGTLLVAGLLTSLGAAGLVGILFVAFWTVHRAAGFWVTARPDEGWEYVATLSVGALALAIAGPGRISLDHAIGIADNLDGWIGAIIVAGAVPVSIGQIRTFWRPGEKPVA